MVGGIKMHYAGIVWRVAGYVIKPPSFESIQNQGQRYHEPAVEAVVAMVVHELEQLNVER